MDASQFLSGKLVPIPLTPGAVSMDPSGSEGRERTAASSGGVAMVDEPLGAAADGREANLPPGLPILMVKMVDELEVISLKVVVDENHYTIRDYLHYQMWSGLHGPVDRLLWCLRVLALRKRNGRLWWLHCLITTS